MINDKELREAEEKYGRDAFRVGMGAESVKELLKAVDLDATSEQLKKEVNDFSGQKRLRAIKRLEVVEAFRKSHNKPEWIILDVVPVIPPELRPMVQLDGGQVCHQRLERFVSPGDQPQQPFETLIGTQSAGHHCAQ